MILLINLFYCILFFFLNQSQGLQWVIKKDYVLQHGEYLTMKNNDISNVFHISCLSSSSNIFALLRKKKLLMNI